MYRNYDGDPHVRYQQGTVSQCKHLGGVRLTTDRQKFHKPS